MTQTTIIVGGVAGGASCAARLRRLDETARIIMVERGPHVSFANCGLPYFVGGVIADEAELLITSPRAMRQKFAIDVRTMTTATAIDVENRTITLESSEGSVTESWDNIVLSPGASPIVPPLPGVDLPGVFTIRNVPDAVAVRRWLDQQPSIARAVIIGGGFIGLEMAENLVHRQMEVTIVEAIKQVMPPLDVDIAQVVEQRLSEHGVTMHLGEALAQIEPGDGQQMVVVTASGRRIPCEMVVMAVGVRPENALARTAGCALGSRGHIVVDEQMRTSVPGIYAVGDAVQVTDVISGDATALPLAGPANRQGRVAAGAIAGRDDRFRGVQGTAVLGLFGLTAGCTGLSRKACIAKGIPQVTVRLHPTDHVGYYPGAATMHLQVVFDPQTRRVLGAQAVGEQGIDKRIDVIAMAIQMRATIDDLAEAELCYAPQYGAAKDAINLAGMIAVNHADGLSPLTSVEAVDEEHGVVVDVRTDTTLAVADGAHPLSIDHHIPIDQLRSRLHELPKDRRLNILCMVGQTAHNATRVLRQNGFDAQVISGGMRSWNLIPS